MIFETKIKTLLESSDGIPVIMGFRNSDEKAQTYYALYGIGNTINYIAKVKNGKLVIAEGTDKLSNFDISETEYYGPKELGKMLSKLKKG